MAETRQGLSDRPDGQGHRPRHPSLSPRPAPFKCKGDHELLWAFALDISFDSPHAGSSGPRGCAPPPSSLAEEPTGLNAQKGLRKQRWSAARSNAWEGNLGEDKLLLVAQSSAVLRIAQGLRTKDPMQMQETNLVMATAPSGIAARCPGAQESG